MISKLTIIGSVLVFAFSLAENRSYPVNVCPPEAHVLEVGEFHGEEIDAQTGEEWLGLHISGDKSMLLNYRLTVEPVHDVLVDEEGEKTGKRVSVDLPLTPAFLVSSDWVLTEGQALTIFEGKDDERLDPKSSLNLKLHDAIYELKIVGGEDAASCGEYNLPKNARLVLASNGVTQDLYSLEDCGNDPSWQLLWAGDLDKDGNLDLYVSVTHHYNVAQRKLFLSSQADEEQLVAEVAEFVTSGC